MKKLFLLSAMGALFASVNAQLSPVINEFSINHVGSDTEEYVELFANAGFDFSTFRILEIEGDASSQGTIDEVITPGTADASGFWTALLATDALENGSVTLLLVSNFTGALGNDLDTNNDGVFDVTPWGNILDSIGISDGGAGDFTYSSVVLIPSFDGGTNTVGGASRIPNGVDTDSVSDWMRNDFDLAGIPGFTGTPVVGEALNTPNAVNQAVPEPATLAALGLGAMALIRRKRK